MSLEARKEEFDKWDQENPIIWELFKRFSFEAIDKGHKKMSHWLIINRIRWETYISTTGHDYKICNNYIAFYARKWQNEFPQYADFYKTKKMKDELISGH